MLFESVTGVAGGVDRSDRTNSTDDVFVSILAFVFFIEQTRSKQKTLTNIHMILVERVGDAEVTLFEGIPCEYPIKMVG